MHTATFRQHREICSRYTMEARQRTDQCLLCVQSLARLPSIEIHWLVSLSQTKMHSRSYAKSIFKRTTRSFSYACKSSTICFSRRKTNSAGIRAQIETWIWTRVWEKLSWSRVYLPRRVSTIIRQRGVNCSSRLRIMYRLGRSKLRVGSRC